MWHIIWTKTNNKQYNWEETQTKKSTGRTYKGFDTETTVIK